MKSFIFFTISILLLCLACANAPKAEEKSIDKKKAIITVPVEKELATEIVVNNTKTEATKSIENNAKKVVSEKTITEEKKSEASKKVANKSNSIKALKQAAESKIVLTKNEVLKTENPTIKEPAPSTTPKIQDVKEEFKEVVKPVVKPILIVADHTKFQALLLSLCQMWSILLAS